MKRLLMSAFLSATVAVSIVGAQGQVRDPRLKPGPPPLPTCSGASNCESGTLLCQDAGDWDTLPITIVSGYSVSSDGRGPYILGGNIKTAGAGAIGGLFLAPLNRKLKDPRAIVVDLDHPVPGGGGVARGVIADDSDLTLAGQWYTGADLVRHSFQEIPTGVGVYSDQFNVGVHINGVYHVLQMGPQPIGHCHANGTAIYGTGTTQATIYRASASRWDIDLPPGSIGRLFDVHNTDPYAANKGLYYIDLHVIVGQ